ncbi:peptidoglycan DD-metalloendopeptidase family protein [Anaerobacillus isosaccharinicus]|uniref:M23 family metallopeptidase n=1 Tax=Anaerobacillus isosaccharinicus TaxID=1532552 RepID=A0A1S2MD48_9BACI|nr:M23 family metallopeptidase [Anaerobacillus isosaccharinicus]MBA5587809.1 M23 family metallopeptidase [Anaerobacillus isosaccharinicus]QOY34035.1 M23 family metallopeptidase [Anaerobacillus isosaccharinicus]
MAKRVDEIRREIQARRKKMTSRIGQRERSQPQYYQSHSESRDDSAYYFPSESRVTGEPEEKFFRKDILMMQVLAAICLFLVIGILFRTQLPQFEGARQFVKNSYEQEFQFATVANWYEDQFGKPLALLPTTRNVALDNLDNQEHNLAYAVPATGRVTRSFDQDGKGIMIETVSNSNVEAARSGMVRFVAEEENLGKTVIIAHYDGGESWYAMLDKVEVSIYDHVEAGSKIGTVSLQDNKGFYYFALKEGETFINPLEVISFD